MSSETDAIRSLQRFVASVLDDFPQITPESDPPTAAIWDVQRARREPQDRPGAVVRALPVSVPTGTAYTVHMLQPFELYVWPLGVEGNPVASEDEAQKLRTKLRLAFTQGKLPSRAYRIAAYDYAGLDWDEALPVDAEPVGFFPVRNLAVQVRQDPDADDLYTIYADLRLYWVEQGDTSRFDGETFTGIHIKRFNDPDSEAGSG